MRFLRNNFLVFCVLIFGTSCTSVNDFFGNSIIPPSQGMTTLIDSTMKVRTTLFSLDSMVGNTAGTCFLGSYIDPLTGLTSAQFLTTFINSTENKTDSLFGDQAVMDSMKLQLTVGNYVGDTTRGSRYTIYQIRDTVIRPSRLYYTSTDAEPFYDRNKPVASFELRGQSSVTVRLPSWFYEQFYYPRPMSEDDKKTNPYYVDSLFVKMFKGLYFKSDDTPMAAGDGKMAMINLSNTVSNMKLYYHNMNSWGKWSGVRVFMFYNTEAYYTTGVQFIQKDYSLADPSAGGIDAATIGDQTLSVPTAYIQSITGLGSRVVLDTAHFSVIRDNAAKDGFKHIAVHKAELRWKIKEQTVANYDRSYSSLVLYYNLNKRVYSPDYPNIQTPQGQTVNPMGGYFDRLSGYYTQNITSTVQQLITGKLTDNALQMLPTIEQIGAFKRAAVYGSGAAENAPELIITYTLLR